MLKFEYNETEHKERLNKYIKRFNHINKKMWKSDVEPSQFFLFWENIYFDVTKKFYKDKLEPFSKRMNRFESEEFIIKTFKEKYEQRVEKEVESLTEILDSLEQDVIDLQNENEQLKKIIEGFGNL